MKRKGGRRATDLAKVRFGLLVAESRVESTRPTRSGGVPWLCRCDCGAMKVVLSGNLVYGNIVSCGAHPDETVDATTDPHMATFAEIGEAIGVSRQRARNIYEQAMRKIRNNPEIMRQLKDLL